MPEWTLLALLALATLVLKSWIEHVSRRDYAPVVEGKTS